MATLVVPLHHFFERALRAVVHVGRREGDVADRGRLEGPRIVRVFRDDEPAQVGTLLGHADAEIVVFLIGEIGPDMAGRAVALLGEEDIAAPFGRLRHRVFLEKRGRLGIFRRQIGIVGDVFLVEPLKRSQQFVVVVGGGGGDERPLKGGDRLADAVDRQLAKDLLKLRLVDRVFAEPLHDAFMRKAHLHRVGDRADRLRLERIDATVPKLRARENPVVSDR